MFEKQGVVDHDDWALRCIVATNNLKDLRKVKLQAPRTTRKPL